MASTSDTRSVNYTRLLKDIRAWLIRFFSLRLPVAHIEDVVQETLIAVHERRHTYDTARSFRPWLTGIAAHKHVDYLRASSRRAEVDLPLDLEDKGSEEALITTITLSQLLTTLKPAQREAIHLVKIKGFTVEEAATKTGQSSSLVKINVHRGLAKVTQKAKLNAASASAK